MNARSAEKKEGAKDKERMNSLKKATSHTAIFSPDELNYDWFVYCKKAHFAKNYKLIGLYFLIPLFFINFVM
jgi:hypothetical protein